MIFLGWWKKAKRPLVTASPGYNNVLLSMDKNKWLNNII